jgi:hypothetical protein
VTAPLLATVGIGGSGTEIEAAHRRLSEALGGRALHTGAFERGRWSDEAVASATRFWRRRMAAEHRSVAVFLHVGAQLIEANASLDAKTVMLRLAQDELRHTEICGVMVQALGAVPEVEMDVAVAPIATHAGCSVGERALRNVIYTTCLSEMIAVARLVDALEHTEDETARAVTRAILADEVMHGMFGFHYLAAIGPALAADAALRDSLAVYLRHAFAVLEREMVHGLAGAPRPSAEAMKLGVIDPARAREVFYQSIAAAIVPGLEQHGLAADAAWRARSVVADPRTSAPASHG